MKGGFFGVRFSVFGHKIGLLRIAFYCVYVSYSIITLLINNINGISCLKSLQI